MEEKYLPEEEQKGEKDLASLTKEDLSNPVPGNTFPRKEHLKSRKRLETLIHSGHQLRKFPIKVYFKISDGDSMPPLKAAFTVPKRHFKLAVDRNRIKRQMIAIYRQNKSELLKRLMIAKKEVDLLWIYSGNERITYIDMERKMKDCLSSIKL